ncbi:MATE efflux family protein [Ascobolus immersus RN42]|uniref:MATE efflux family protein n=1 Tax=Ascobolus immersus RN42 TaxID=1160509 RepID=A0A3N4IL79_ASCIM|nr:MATE efflux family protein [Ascobolus immersus RN42]
MPQPILPSGLSDHLDAAEANLIAQGVVHPARVIKHVVNGEHERLLGNAPKTGQEGGEDEVVTTWQLEAKELSKNSIPLVITLALQYSLTLASVFSAGNLGSNELAAVSLAGMTANITGYAIYQGLATALDTLCAQAYGSGNKHMVGVHFQRMAVFLMVLTVPISIVWMYSEEILKTIIPEDELSRLAGLYLRILVMGAPGYALFECGKRYTQAQGLFMASTIVLLICAPLNAFLNYTLVWHPTIGMGFAGAPTAVVIIDYLMPLLLFLYVRFVAGSECWGGFSKRAFTNWWPMIQLALPGLVMVEAEYLAFEVLTLMASYFSTAHVAAQAIVAQAGSVMYQIPFALSIAASTRVGTFVGGMSPNAAKITSSTSLVMSVVIGTFNGGLLLSTRFLIPQCFTDDSHVIAIAAAAMPIVGFFQIFDSISAVAAGVLRGQGRQYVGSYTNLVTYYVAALPWSWYSGFVLGWEVKGLWSGMAMALAIIAFVEVLVVLLTNWQRVVGEARARESWA